MNIPTEFTINGDEYYIETVHIVPSKFKERINPGTGDIGDVIFEYTMTPDDMMKYIERCPTPTMSGL